MKTSALHNVKDGSPVETADQTGATTHRIKSTRANDAPYLRPDEAAELLGISRRSLSNFQRRHLIGFSKLGRVVVFRRCDIEAAIQKFHVAAAGE